MSNQPYNAWSRERPDWVGSGYVYFYDDDIVLQMRVGYNDDGYSLQLAGSDQWRPIAELPDTTEYVRLPEPPLREYRFDAPGRDVL